MHARVLRIGQLSGDRSSGTWNDTEAVALMLRSALSTGALPALDERPSWLPVDQCAQAVADIAVRDLAADQPHGHDANLVYHLVNPHTFSWKHDLLPALKQCSRFPPFEILSPQEWFQRLANSEQDPEKNLSIKLIDFWRSKYGKPSATKGESEAGFTAHGADEAPGLVFETDQTIRACPSLGRVHDPVSEGLFQKYVDVWLKKWVVI